MMPVSSIYIPSMFSWFGDHAPLQCFAKRPVLAQLPWIGFRTAQCRKQGIKDSHAIREFPLITPRYAEPSSQPRLYSRRETSRSWSTAMIGRVPRAFRFGNEIRNET